MDKLFEFLLKSEARIGVIILALVVVFLLFSGCASMDDRDCQVVADKVYQQCLEEIKR